MPEPSERPRALAPVAQKLIESAVAGGAALAALTGSPEAVAAAAAAPMVSQGLAEAGAIIRQRWHRNAAAMVVEAGRRAQLEDDKLLQRLLATPSRQELLNSALEAAAHATLEEKIKAIGAALANGTFADQPAVVDQQFVQAMAELDAAHIRVLEHISEAQSRGPQGVATRELSELPWLTSASLFPLLAALQRHGAVISHGEGGVIGGQSGPARWTATEFGFECLDRLREAAHEDDQGP